ncbi:MAG: hypothetical protein AB8B46_04905 [Candidatus Midichloriaceae bacterium]
MTNQFNKVVAANGKVTNLFTNLLYNIRNQNYNGAQYGNINYLNYKIKTRNGKVVAMMLKFALKKTALIGFLKLINHLTPYKFQF